MYYHTRKSMKRYQSFGKPTVCTFCHLDPHMNTVVQETPHSYVLTNRSFYSHWELSNVIDHLMIIPKRHVLTLAELNPDERTDVMDLIAAYESQDYNIYARSPVSKTRSVPHQHTHLIKTDHKPRRGMFFLRKPYILWRFR